MQLNNQRWVDLFQVDIGSRFNIILARPSHLLQCFAVEAGSVALGVDAPKIDSLWSTLSTCTAFWRRTQQCRRAIGACWLNLCAALPRFSSGEINTIRWCSSECPFANSSLMSSYSSSISLSVSFWKRTCSLTFCILCDRRAEVPASFACNCYKPSTFSSRTLETRRPCVCTK